MKQSVKFREEIGGSANNLLTYDRNMTKSPNWMLLYFKRSQAKKIA